MEYEKKYVWSVLFRLCHWGFALSIVFLAVTGWYIHDPWTNTMVEGNGRFPMAEIRQIHFIAGFVFTASVLVRLFLYLFGNSQERLVGPLPVTRANIKNFFSTLGFYGYVTDEHEERLGHNALAGLVYLFTWLVALLQLISGFYLLYPENTAWQDWGLAMFGTQQQGRFVHYLIMWYFLLFTVTHLYMLAWNDLKSPEGLISSIVNGYKFKARHDNSAKV
ncbi:MAG: Ni/Fe-hydrogenase, b-type cytochrome subunit [Thermodesulfobacteriota bacterium]